MIHKPATPLPWHIEESSIIRSGGKSLAKTYRGGQGNILADTDAAYIVHAANAYPRLVKRIRETADDLKRWRASGSIRLQVQTYEDQLRALLHELGEDA